MVTLRRRMQHPPGHAPTDEERQPDAEAGTAKAESHPLWWAAAALVLGLIGLWVLSREHGAPRTAVLNVCPEATLVFVPSAAALTSEAQGRLTRTASCLSADSARRVRVVGRALPDERAGLARDRAEATASMLRQHGARAEQLTLEVAGPVCRQKSAACEQQNRSVAIVPVASAATK